MAKPLTKGQKTALTNKKRYGKNYYHEIGKLSAINKNNSKQAKVRVKFEKSKRFRVNVNRKTLLGKVLVTSRG